MLLTAEAPDAMTVPMVPDDGHQSRTCRDHRPFASYEAALLHYVTAVREGRGDPGQEVFWCRACRHWHHGGTQVRSYGRLLAESGWRDEVHNA